MRMTIAALSAMLVAGCAGIDKSAVLPEGAWEMGAASFDGGGHNPATLQIHNGRLSAHSGCNTATGAVSAADGRLLAAALATTRRGCPEPLGSFETRYFRLLAAKPAFRIDNGLLSLEAGGDRAQFRPAPEPRPYP